MESELLNEITQLVISLVIVLQITPWVLILVGVFILRWLELHDRGLLRNSGNRERR